MSIVFRRDLTRKFHMDYFSWTARKSILCGFMSTKSDKIKVWFFLKGSWNITIFLRKPWKHQQSLVFWKYKGVEKGNTCLLCVNLLSTYHIYLIHSVIRKQIQLNYWQKVNSNGREQKRDGGMGKREIPHELTFILGIFKFTKTILT